MTEQSLGLIETIGLTAAVEAADAAVKAANVQLVGYELAKGEGMTVVKLLGDVGAIKAAVSAGAAAAGRVNRVISTKVIARPAAALSRLVDSAETVGIAAQPHPADIPSPVKTEAPAEQPAEAPAESPTEKPVEEPAAAKAEPPVAAQFQTKAETAAADAAPVETAPAKEPEVTVPPVDVPPVDVPPVDAAPKAANGKVADEKPAAKRAADAAPKSGPGDPKPTPRSRRGGTAKKAKTT
ncbi:BMC domain-containing protein [Rhodobium gokarnense]|uniref:Microcompartment protein CcmL/EutN n=1 Tax=Rhodobium gokarnense TaxID=364296 RepID=A0ABT3HB79_9HYPH|nr:BMC domain-containing protein [Rhodobium gokarnense]MCW2307640.1 microcompartment protein CcmL/EutN [Rhodobium gokarnense]